MPLYDLDRVRQNPIGRQSRWNLFRTFQDSPLHATMVTMLAPYLEQSTIDAGAVASDILTRIDTGARELLAACDSDEAGELFRMTLWNVLAQHPQSWYYYAKVEDDGEPACTIYFRP